MAGARGADSLADVGELLDPAGEVGDPGGDAAGVRDLVAEPGGGDHAPGEGGDQGPVMIGLLLATAGDGHHVLQVLPHRAQQLHTKVDLPLEESRKDLNDNPRIRLLLVNRVKPRLPEKTRLASNRDLY